MKKIIAPFVLDVIVATAGTYVAVSQLLEGFSWLRIPDHGRPVIPARNRPK